MAVMIPSQNPDFDSKREYYFSAPTSPSHLSQFYTHFHQFSIAAADDGESSATVPFAWEVKPGTPKSPVNGDDFVFDLSQDWETASLSAEELFDGGVIKPLKPPPPPAINENVTSRRKNRGFEDPFAVGARNAAEVVAPPPRGRERGVAASRHRAARSLSPLRDEPYMAETTKEEKKWKLMDLFLFRSASEGRAADKDPLKKYTAAAMRRSSFRAVESPGSRSGSIKRGHVSAHELHYTMNRAVSQDLKKKTFLPYKQGILGRLAFNPAVHALANGFGFSRK